MKLFKDTHSLFAPGTTNGHNLFTVKSKLLLKTLHRKYEGTYLLCELTKFQV